MSTLAGAARIFDRKKYYQVPDSAGKPMKNSLATTSLLLFAISVILWGLLTVFESALVGMPAGTERIITFLLLVIPTGIGAILGLMSLVRKGGRKGPAVAGLVLNGLFALFIMVILLFAG
jgi:uncharacterized membrane protein YuzA (DUF378 family)